MRVPGIGRIRESTKKLSGGVLVKVEFCEYRKTVESVRVPGIGRIRESTKKLTGRVAKNGQIVAGTENR